MANRIPSLDGSGFITDPSLKIDYLMASYSATQYSQTVLFRSSISSFSKDIQLASQQWDKLPALVNASLVKLFNSYFDTVELSVYLDEKSLESNSEIIKLLIEGVVQQNNSTYQLSRELYLNHKKTSSVTDFGPGNISYDR